MSNYNTGYTVAGDGLRNASTGIQGKVAGPMGQFAGVKRALGSPAGRIGTQALMGMMNGQNPGQAALGAGMDYGKSELMKYGAKQLLGGALGGQAAGFLGGPYGMLAMAALPYVGKGISSLGRSLGIGKRSGPSAQEMAMGQAKNDMMGYKGSYAADMGRGQSMLDKYNPMLEAQIGKIQDLADRGLSTDYNTRRMAGAAASNAAATRAAEARLASQGGMIGGGQGLSQFAGIGQAGVAGNAAGAYQAAINDMNQQPGYINQLAGMIGGQINRGQGLLNQGRQGMFGIDQTMYNLNAQEKARADALSQANRAREAQMISGVANLAGTAAGMEQSRKQNRDYMNMLYGNGKQSSDSTGVASNYQYNNGYIGDNGQAFDNNQNPVQRVNAQGLPIDQWGNVDTEAWFAMNGGQPPANGTNSYPGVAVNPTTMIPDRFPVTPLPFNMGQNTGGQYVTDPSTGRQVWVPSTSPDAWPNQQEDDGWVTDPITGQRNWRGY